MATPDSISWADTEELFRALGEELAEVCEALSRAACHGPDFERAVLANARERIAKDRAEQAAGRDRTRVDDTTDPVRRTPYGP